MTAARQEPASPSRLIASEVRAEMGRKGLTRRGIAAELGVSHAWVTRRVSLAADVEITMEDAERFASALGVPVTVLIDPWLKAVAARPAAPGGGQAFLPLGEGFGAPSGTRTPNPLIQSHPAYPVVVPLRKRPHTSLPREAARDTLPSTLRTRHLRVVGQEAS